MSKLKETLISKPIEIGWLHKYSQQTRYQQIKTPDGGGTRKITLNNSDIESVEKLIKRCIKVFQPTDKLELLKNATFKLGRWGQKFISNFQLSNGKTCNLLEYLKSQQIPTKKIHLYIYSSEDNNESSQESSSSDVSSSETEETSSKKTAELYGMKKRKKKSNKENKDVSPPKIASIVSNEQQLTEPIDKSNENILQTEQNSITEKSIVDFLENNKHSTEINDLKLRNGDVIEVEYLYLKFSEHTGNPIWGYYDKERLKDALCDDYPNLRCVQIQEFDPLEYDCQIARIVKNGICLFEINLDDTGYKKEFSYPCFDKEIKKHQVLYQIADLTGYCNGQLGVGCITACDETCKPVFKWSKNGVINKSGPYLYWIAVDSVESDNWKCDVECTKKLDQVNISKDVSVFDKNFLPEISLSELEDTGIQLGQGGQGTVQKYKYIQDFVAVKTMEIFGKNGVEIMKRELEICSRVRNTNIIQMIGACIEPRRFHLIMEYFEGPSLYDILFNPKTWKLKSEFDLTIEKKNKIIEKICLAIAYLHKQKVPIVHRDIKCANILVNKHLVVKVCDLGLTKYKECRENFQTSATFPGFKGTKNYCAPEILLNKAKETSTLIASDIWALGCTICEIYSEDYAWDVVSYDNGIEDILKKQLIPDLSAVPVQLQDILKKCFLYDPLFRASITDILDVIQKM